MGTDRPQIHGLKTAELDYKSHLKMIDLEELVCVNAKYFIGVNKNSLNTGTQYIFSYLIFAFLFIKHGFKKPE